MIDIISRIHGSDAPEPMTNEREARILDRYIAEHGAADVKKLAIHALIDTLRDLVLDEPLMLPVSVGGCAVALEMLAMTLDEDTTPYEILMLKALEDSLEEYDDE